MATPDNPFDFPPPHIPPPPPPATSPQILPGRYLVLGGIVFAFLPILITLVASIFMGTDLNEGNSAIGALPWLTFFTFPVGVLIAFIGTILGVVNVVRRKK